MQNAFCKRNIMSISCYCTFCMKINIRRFSIKFEYFLIIKERKQTKYTYKKENLKKNPI